MRVLLAILLIWAIPASAEDYRNALFAIQPGPMSISGDTLSLSLILENTTTEDYQLLLVSASAIDDQGRRLALSGEPRGIHADTRDSCAATGSVVSAGGRQVISLPFKAPQGVSWAGRTFSLALELQTPDRRQMFGCRTYANLGWAAAITAASPPMPRSS